MPTITLTLTDDTLARLRAGETTLTLTATLRERKPKSAPLPPSLVEAHRRVSELWGTHQPGVSIPLAWKLLRPLCEEHGADTVIEALGVYLDWNRGRAVQPVWFVREYAQWQTRADMDLMTAEAERAAFRHSMRLRG